MAESWEEKIAIMKQVKDNNDRKAHGKKRKTENDEDGVQKVTEITDVTNFEDLLVLVVGTRGKWNLLLFFLTCYGSFVSPFQTLSYQFIGATPTYWCHIPELIEANWTAQQIHDFATPYNNATEKYDGCEMYNRNYTDAAEMSFEAAQIAFPSTPGNTISCRDGRDFNLSEYTSTVTIEWDLVCERRALYSTTQAAAQIGKLFGYLLVGYFLDTCGRRLVVLWSSLGAVIVAYAASFMPDVYLFIFLKIAINATTSGIYLGCFIIQMETAAAKERSLLGTMFVVPWALGYMLVPGVAYLVRSWRWLQAALSIPTLFLIGYYWLLPESPRWLILQGRHSEALEVMRKGAAMNGKTMPSDELVLAAMKRISAKDEEIKKPSMTEVLVKFFKAIIYNAEIRKKALTVFFCWFTAALVYYGVALNATNLSTDIYLYLFLGGLLEIPSYLLLWPAIVFLGRVKSLALLYFACSVSILIVMALMLSGPGVPVWVTMVLSLAGKMAITAGFHLIWLFTAELFPTSYRSLIVSLSSVTARIGSSASPYINDILGEVVTWAPSLVFGAVSLVAAGLSLLLPETQGQNMPEDETENKGIQRGGQVNPGFTSDSSDHQRQMPQSSQVNKGQEDGRKKEKNTNGNFSKSQDETKRNTDQGNEEERGDNNEEVKGDTKL